MCLNCGCRLSKGIESKKVGKSKVKNVRYGAGTWRSGAGLSDPCAVAQEGGARAQTLGSLRSGATKAAQWRRNDDKPKWRSESGAMAQPRVILKNAATSSSSSQH
jgi:hypothetical protein